MYDIVLFTWNPMYHPQVVLTSVIEALRMAGITYSITYEKDGTATICGDQALPPPSARDSWVIVGDRCSMAHPHSLRDYPLDQKMKMLDRAIDRCGPHSEEPYFQSPFYHAVLLHFKRYLALLS
jgi:hypothetical protein